MMRAQENQKPYDKMVKILLIGNSGVGKSSVLLQYSDKKFAHNYYNTIGVDYRIKYVKMRGLNIKVQIWDTAGQDRFRTITSSYYRGADGIIVVYDVTDRTSYDNVKVWLEEIEKYVEEKTKKYIVGNKNDLEERRQIKVEEAQQFTAKLGIPFKETSARLATNVEVVFEDLIETILDSDGGSNFVSRFSRQNGSSYTAQPSGQENPVRQTKPAQQHLSIREMMQKEKQEKDKQKGCCLIY